MPHGLFANVILPSPYCCLCGLSLLCSWLSTTNMTVWGIWKKLEPLEIDPRMVTSERIPFGQRRRHQSVIRNNSGEGILVVVMSMSIWSAGLESVMAGAGAGFESNVEDKFYSSASAAIRVPQLVVIPPGHSHWFEIPRVSFFDRKAMVVIASEGEDPKMRVQVMVNLRSSTLLTVSLGPSRTRGRVVVDTLTRENLISHDKANEQRSSPQADRSDTETAPASTCDTASNGESSPIDFVEVDSEDGGIISKLVRAIQKSLSASAAFLEEASTASATCDGSIFEGIVNILLDHGITDKLRSARWDTRS